MMTFEAHIQAVAYIILLVDIKVYEQKMLSSSTNSLEMPSLIFVY